MTTTPSGSRTAVRPRRFALIGNPNCGKTTLFNALTGLRQKVGNYPGVTVEKKTGACFSQHGEPLEILDLPGVYSLLARSPDEVVARDVLLGLRSDTPAPDAILCVVDASNLERNLYLLTQILDIGKPVVLALNMTDLAAARGCAVDAGALSHELGIPVIPCQANQGKGLLELKLEMSRVTLEPPAKRCPLPGFLLPLVHSLASEDGPLSYAHALLFLADKDSHAAHEAPLPEGFAEHLDRTRAQLQAAHPDWQEQAVETRYHFIQEICTRSLRRSSASSPDMTEHLDALLTHPVFGWVAFVGLMSLMFLSIFLLAGYPMDWISTLFDGLDGWVKDQMTPGDFRDLVTDGVLAGVGGVVIFLPQILILFFFIGLLEDTGYMARAAFIMDRVMSRVGLHGKSFIPLLSSYACAIPGIMATRTIENPKDRLVTILVAPFMSCSARLPVYAIMIALLFPVEGASVLAKTGILLVMYFLGTAAAFGCAWLLKKTLLKGETPMLLMELPPYRRPVLRTICLHMWERGRLFLQRAGTVILGLSILLWFLATYPKPADPETAHPLEYSYAGKIGHAIEPMIEPLGFNWKIGIGLVASQAAREVFVSTMAIVYSVEDDEENTVPLQEAMRADRWPDGRPVFTPLVCLSLMVFYVLAMQCISTLAVVRRETNSWRWPLFQLVYMTALAYLASLAVYQGGRWLGF
jgi:ferrous iron transport protein B